MEIKTKMIQNQRPSSSIENERNKLCIDVNLVKTFSCYQQVIKYSLNKDKKDIKNAKKIITRRADPLKDETKSLVIEFRNKHDNQILAIPLENIRKDTYLKSSESSKKDKKNIILLH